MDKPLRILVTNDDGFDSFFLRVLVDQLAESYTVAVAAPASEQSWIGRAVSRRGRVSVTADDGLGVPGWRVAGSPTDCVNLALGHLLDFRPDMVVSGINLGFNTTVPLTFSSGTIAGALEGAFWGLPAIAFSKVVPMDQFERISESRGFVEGEFGLSLHAAARRAVGFVDQILSQPLDFPVVHNINFPLGTTDSTPVDHTLPLAIQMASLFDKVDDSTYAFRFRQGELQNDPGGSDVHTLEKGRISHSILDFARIGRAAPMVESP